MIKEKLFTKYLLNVKRPGKKALSNLKNFRKIIPGQYFQGNDFEWWGYYRRNVQLGIY